MDLTLTTLVHQVRGLLLLVWSRRGIARLGCAIGYALAY